MSIQVASILAIVLGLTLAALAGFAWPVLSRLPMNRLRSSIFGAKATRIMSVVAGLLCAALGCFGLIAGAS